MNNEEKLDSLTNQTVTISLGSKQYIARRATLYDVGVMNKKRKELEKSENPNLELDVSLFMLCEMMKGLNPGNEVIDPVALAKSIPFENFRDVTDSLEKVGFKLPQTPKKNVEVPGTGA